MTIIFNLLLIAGELESVSNWYYSCFHCWKFHYIKEEIVRRMSKDPDLYEDVILRRASIPDEEPGCPTRQSISYSDLPIVQANTNNRLIIVDQCVCPILVRRPVTPPIPEPDPEWYYKCWQCRNWHFVQHKIMEQTKKELGDLYNMIRRGVRQLEADNPGCYQRGKILKNSKTYKYCMKKCQLIQVQHSRCPRTVGTYNRPCDVPLYQNYTKKVQLPSGESCEVPSPVRSWIDTKCDERVHWANLTNQEYSFKTSPLDVLWPDNDVNNDERINRMRSEGDSKEHSLQSVPYIEKIGPEDVECLAIYDNHPTPVSTNPAAVYEDWTFKLFESKFGAQVEAQVSLLKQQDQQIADLTDMVHRLLLQDVDRTAILPQNIKSITNEALHLDRLLLVQPLPQPYGQIKPKVLTACYITRPHKTPSANGIRWSSERLLCHFELECSGSDPIKIHFLIEHACVKSVTSSNVVRKLYNAHSSTKPCAPSRPLPRRLAINNNGNAATTDEPHTRLFWCDRHKQVFTNIHYFNFAIPTIKDETISHCISVNECPSFKYDVVVLGQDTLRHRGFVYMTTPKFAVHFKHYNDGHEYNIPNPGWLRVIDRYQHNEKEEVLMCDAARFVLFHNASTEEPRFEDEEDNIRNYHNLPLVFDVIPESPNYVRLSRKSLYK